MCGSDGNRTLTPRGDRASPIPPLGDLCQNSICEPKRRDRSRLARAPFLAPTFYFCFSSTTLGTHSAASSREEIHGESCFPCLTSDLKRQLRKGGPLWSRRVPEISSHGQMPKLVRAWPPAPAPELEPGRRSQCLSSGKELPRPLQGAKPLGGLGRRASRAPSSSRRRSTGQGVTVREPVPATA